MTPTSIPVTNNTAAEIKGIHNGESKISNAVFQDNDKTGAIMLPSVNPSSVNNPTEGLLIFDSSAGNIFYFDGVNWHEVK